MNTEQKLIEYLKVKYNPTAIVLHGSRAINMFREHSDWDFVIFTKSDIKPITREIVFDANIEIKQIILPINEDKFSGFFFRKSNTKILYDPESIVEKILQLNDMKISLGNNFTNEDREKRYAFLRSALDGITDYYDLPLNMFDKKIDFYTRVIDSWFRFIKNEFEPSHYIAFPRIKNEDIEFYELINSFVSSNDAQILLSVGNDMLHRLFRDLCFTT